MAKNYKIIVYAKRNDQPVYSYVAYPSVKASKVWDIIDDVAFDIAKHESRAGFTWHLATWRRGDIVTTNSPDWKSVGKFIVRGWPL